MKYKHTNIISKDWRALVHFYEEVFECVRVPPERHMAGEWLERGTGVPGAAIDGVHLRLPGWGEAGPTLEIFQYARNEPKPAPAANREGFSHLAFEVENVEACLRAVIARGGRAIGSAVSRTVEGVGRLTFVYAADPEGNILELQSRG
ncbi:MAG: VOC family protein [Anaerolineales bacterium]|nr:VOC family protein [Anaerolineales bacterium]